MIGIQAVLNKVLPYRLRRFVRRPAYMWRGIVRDMKSLLGFYHFENRIIMVIGLPKSGTTWVENFLFEVPGYVARELAGDSDEIMLQNLPEGCFKRAPKGCYSYYKTHANPTEANICILDEAGIKKRVILIRDLRDVAVSRYYHMLASPKQRHEPHYMDYGSMSKEDGLADSVEMILQYYIPWLEGWLDEINRNPDRYLLVRYEDLRKDPEGTFLKISQFFSLGLNRSEVARILDTLRNKRVSKIVSDSPAGIRSTFRKGKVGGWKEEFGQAHRVMFDDDKDLLRRAGYDAE